MRILSVATEWGSAHGGLSTLNRKLCEALAAAGQEVWCFIQDGTDEDREAAKRSGVKLVVAEQRAGLRGRESLMQRPLPDGVVPELVIGHGRITGPYARHAADSFRGARRMHIIHMDADDIEWYKSDRADESDRDTDPGARARTRRKIEIELSRTADVVVTVGPRLHDRYVNLLQPYGVTPLRLDPGFDGGPTETRNPPEPNDLLKILFFGRIEDWELKGLDLAAQAFGIAAEWYERHDRQTRLELHVVGAQHGTSTDTHAQILNWVGKHGNAYVYPYTTDSEDLGQELMTASLVLMPSRSEGFGLAGLEAIMTGVPVLMSEQSGLGKLLGECLINRQQRLNFVVPVSRDRSGTVHDWGHAINHVLWDRQSAFIRASHLRRILAEGKSWASAVEDLLSSIQESETDSAYHVNIGKTQGSVGDLIEVLADATFPGTSWVDLRTGTRDLRALLKTPGNINDLNNHTTGLLADLRRTLDSAISPITSPRDLTRAAKYAEQLRAILLNLLKGADKPMITSGIERPFIDFTDAQLEALGLPNRIGIDAHQLGAERIAGSIVVDSAICEYAGVELSSVVVRGLGKLETLESQPDFISANRRSSPEPKPNRPKAHLVNWHAPVIDQGDVVTLDLARSDYWTSEATKRLITQIQGEVIDGQIDYMRLPRRLDVHLVVVSGNDNKVLLTQRGSHVATEPSTWMVSVGESMDWRQDEGPTGVPHPSLTAKRCLSERDELNLPRAVVESSTFRLVAIATEWQEMLINLIVVARIPNITFQEIRRHFRKGENLQVDAVPFDPQSCGALLREETYAGSRGKGANMPISDISRFALLAALCAEYPLSDIIN